MKMDKKTIILIVLAIVAIGVVGYQFRGVFSPGRPNAPKPASPSPVILSAAQASAAAPVAGTDESSPAEGYAGYIAKLKESDIAFEDKRFKNPMTPVVKQRGPKRPQPWQSGKEPKRFGPEKIAADYMIEGIVWDNTDPLALVNNQVVGIGEKLEKGAVVTEITRDTVTFNINGTTYPLVLREE